MGSDNKKLLPALAGGILLGFLVGSAQKMRKINNQANKWKRQSDKYEQALLMTNSWLRVKNENKKLETYFIKKGYRTIAIYGMNYIGVRLYEELAGSSVNISYGIDKYSSSSEVTLPVYAPEDCLEEVDAVVVTPVYFFEEIKRELELKLNGPVISLNDVLFEL